MDKTETNLASQFDEINVAELEKSFRELKNEVYFKRNEVLKLKEELDNVNKQNHILKAALNSCSEKLEDTKITKDLLMKKGQEFEPKYYENKSALMKIELQYRAASLKNDLLREELEKLLNDKATLTRQLEIFEEQKTRNKTYFDDVSMKIIQHKNTILQISEEIKKVKDAQQQVLNVAQQIIAKEAEIRKWKESSQIEFKLKEEISVLEDENIKIKANCEQLFQLINGNVIVEEPDLFARIVLTQLKKACNFYRESNEKKDSTLLEVHKLWNEEKRVNYKLIEENEVLRNKCGILEKRIEEMKKSEQMEDKTVEGIRVIETKNLVESENNKSFY